MKKKQYFLVSLLIFLGVLGYFGLLLFPLGGTETEYSFKRLGETGWYLGIAQPLSLIRSKIFGQAVINLAIILMVSFLLFCLYMYARLKKDKEMAAREAKLEKLEMVGQLAAGIAHEIRNPLTSVKGFLQLMQAAPDKIENRDYIEIMLEEVNRIEQITNEFLSLARPTVARVSDFDLNALLVSTYQFLQSHAFMHKVEMRLDLDENLPKISGDAGQMKQVAINLIKNAIEACRSGGKVTISTERRGSNVQVSIIDNGKGIPPEILDKLGTPFLTTKETGTGLGITVCFRIIQNLGGSIQVKTQPEEGTTFTILLPAAN